MRVGTRPTALLAVAMLGIAVLGSGCGRPAEPSAAVTVADTGTAVQSLLAHLYAGALTSAGTAADVARVDGVSGAAAGLDDGSISLLPGFTGSLVAQFDPSSTAREPDDVYATLARSLPEWLTVGDPGLAENGPTVSVTPTLASTLGEATLSSLVPRCGGVSAYVGPDVDVAAVTDALAQSYGCTFARVESSAGPVEVTILRATDRAEGETDVVLADDRDGLTADVLVPLLRKGAVDDAAGERALQTLAGELTTADLARMVDRVRAGEDPATVAEGWAGSGLR